MNEPDQEVEERLRNLKLVPASPELKSRIASRLDEGHSPVTRLRSNRRGILRIGLAAAASIALACGVVFQNADREAAAPTLTVGQEQILMRVSEPNFIEVAGADPMWEIEVQILNRAIIDTPDGGRETILVPEERRVFVPAVYQ